VNRRTVIAVAALIIVAAGALIAWWRPWSPRPAPLDSRWPAVVHTIAGTGAMGIRDGDTARATFVEPFGVAIGGDGAVYVSDAGMSHRVRRITTREVETIAGDGRGFADGRGGAARFNTPSAIAVDAAGSIYVADTGNNAIRKIAPDGQVVTIGGDGLAGYRDGPAAQARFNGPIGVAVDAAGRVIVADTYNDRIRAIAADGTVSTIAGSGEPGAVDGAALDARFDTPCGVAVDRAGRIYVADTGNGVVRIIADGEVSTPVAALPDGLVRPIGIAIGPRGDVYVSDDRGLVLELLANGESRVVAGSMPGFHDGDAGIARFRNPSGIALAGEGRLVVADSGNSLVRLIESPARAVIRLPAAPAIDSAFDADSFARQPLLWPVAPMEGPHEVAGTMGEARGGEGGERFHAGIDVREPQGTPVLAIRDGIVSGPLSSGDFGSLSEWLRIGPLTYIHIRAGRDQRNEVVDPERFVPTYTEDGTLVRMRVKRGSVFTSGEQIATVNAFNHVHVNVGRAGEEINPLRFGLLQFVDTIPPTIARGGVKLFDVANQPLAKRIKGRIVVAGPVRIVVDAWDQANGNKPERRLGLYELGYQILNRNGTPAPGFEEVRRTLRFDRLAHDPEAARLVYLHGSGIPFYGRRRTRFLYVVTNTFGDGRAVEGFWDTTLLPPGDYIVRVLATDFNGNAAAAHRDLPVTVASPAS
jgi:sugar lactone lactonase YvrE